MLHQNCIRKFYISIGYPILPPSKLYEDNQAPIKIILSKIIPPQSSPLNILITDIDEHHLHKHFDMLDKRSNMKLA